MGAATNPETGGVDFDTVLAANAAQINATEETRAFLHNVSTDVLNGTPEQMVTMLKEDGERWARYAKLARIEPQ